MKMIRGAETFSYHSVLILTVRFISAGCDLVNSGKIEEVTGFSGESVLLPCSCTNLHSKPSTVTWKFTSRESKTSADEEIYPNQNKQHRNRVRLTNQNSGNLTLLISDLTAKDHGVYRCSVQHDHKYIRLYIKGRCINLAIIIGKQNSFGESNYEKGLSGQVFLLFVSSLKSGNMGVSKQQLSNDLKTKIVQHHGLEEGNKKLSQRFQLISFHCEEQSEEMENHRHSSS
uniref:Ig-like domain-containing protein n=1 Tax=Astyanax mexicanus TaxID=7994 RepID=A0A3B1KEU0_ASTMX